MTYTPSLREYGDEACDKAAEEAIDKRRKETVRDAICEIIEDEFDRLETDAGYFLTSTATARAEKFYERLLAGDEDAAKELFGGEQDRYKTLGYDSGEPWCHLIHGRLFETKGIEMRRQIVEAHAELIRNERIADLESVVDGLSKQVRQLQHDLEETRNRVRG